MYQTWIPDFLRKYGVPVVLEAGWQTRGSESFSPKGLVIHHDAFHSSVPASQIISMMVNGRPDLPGPLCQVWIDDDRDDTGAKGDPVAHVIAAGRANHAGSGSWKGLEGNSSVLGIEARNAGTGEAWSAAMLDCYAKVCAALLDGIHADTEMMCGHKEWTTRKIDPNGIDMPSWRQRVQGIRRGGGAPIPDEVYKGADMFIAIDSVALCALLGNVLFTFPDMTQYGNAKNASPSVPSIVIGSDVPMAARSDLYKQLLMQHVVAVGQ